MYLNMLLIIALGIGIFILGYFSPLGYSIWILYVFPIFLSFRVAFQSYALLVTTLCSLGIVLGFLYSPQGVTPQLALFNRILEISMLWGVWGLLSQGKRAEEALKISETRYRRLFETAQDGILILDADTGQIIHINPFLLEMLGYTHEYFIGKKLWEIGAFEDVEASKAAFSELQRKGYVRYDDFPLETRDGRHIDVEFVSNVYLVNGKKVIQCNIRDITAHKQAEKLVIKSLDQIEQVKLEWEATVDSLLQLIFLLDEQGHILRANRTVEAWNLGKVEIVHGMEMHTLLHQGCTDQGCYLETLWPQARDKLVQGQSLERELEDSILGRHLSIQIRPILTRKNGLRLKADSFAVAILWDITRRKRIEGERERLIHELQDALTNIKRLRGLFPICASCKKIRDDKGYWNELEAYISEHSEAEFSHGFCPDCMKKLYGAFLDEDTDSKKK